MVLGYIVITGQRPQPLTYAPCAENTINNLNSDGQKFYKYQQNKEYLNSDGQQFHQYQ